MFYLYVTPAAINVNENNDVTPAVVNAHGNNYVTPTEDDIDKLISMPTIITYNNSPYIQ